MKLKNKFPFKEIIGRETGQGQVIYQMWRTQQVARSYTPPVIPSDSQWWNHRDMMVELSRLWRTLNNEFKETWFVALEELKITIPEVYRMMTPFAYFTLCNTYYYLQTATFLLYAPAKGLYWTANINNISVSSADPSTNTLNMTFSREIETEINITVKLCKPKMISNYAFRESERKLISGYEPESCAAVITFPQTKNVSYLFVKRDIRNYKYVYYETRVHLNDGFVSPKHIGICPIITT